MKQSMAIVGGGLAGLPLTEFLQNSRLKEKPGTYEEAKKMISNSNPNLLVLGHTEL